MDAWRSLLNRALARLDAVGVADADWMLGGRTLLMLRYGRRTSRDIDIFVHDVQYLSLLSPRLSDAADAPRRYSEAANALRLVYAEGEIDFLAVAPVIPAATSEPFELEGLPGGRRAVPAMPDLEIVAQKLFYRAWAFTGRDLFDFATIARRNPAVLNDERLKRACAERREILKTSVDAPACAESYAGIVEPRLDLPFEQARETLLRWIEGLEGAASG